MNETIPDQQEGFWTEYAEDCKRLALEDAKNKEEWKLKLTGLIENLDVLFEWLNEDHRCWTPIGIVEIYNTDEKRSGYQNHQHVRIKEDEYRLLYMKQDEDEEEVGVNHYCVWQTSGYLGDDYSGFLLFPLADGRYFKVSYSC